MSVTIRCGGVLNVALAWARCKKKKIQTVKSDLVVQVFNSNIPSVIMMWPMRDALREFA